MYCSKGKYDIMGEKRRLNTLFTVAAVMMGWLSIANKKNVDNTLCMDSSLLQYYSFDFYAIPTMNGLPVDGC